MTTLQLARAIADAVLATTQRRNKNSMMDAPTQAVLRTLEGNDAWFMRFSVDEDGIGIGETERRMEAVPTPKGGERR